MDRIRRLLGSSPPPPPTRAERIETDDVYPIYKADQSKQLRELLMIWTLKFNDVLDPGLLQTSLTELLEIGDWRKLGGRFRQKDDGDLEIHVPRTFSKERPALEYFHSSFPSVIEEHPTAKQIPPLPDHPCLFPFPDYTGFADYPGAPESLEDYLCKDTPIVSLHVLSFQNATLVVLRYSHMLMDAMAQSAFLRAWCLVLSGNASQVPKLLGARGDVVAEIVSESASKMASQEEFILGKRQLKGWKMFLFGLHSIWDSLWNPPSVTKIIFFPKSAIDKLRERAQNDLVSLFPNKEPPFLSDGDILSAWFGQTVAQSLTASRPITLLQTTNLRFRFPVLKGGSYMQNMTMPVWSTLPEPLSLGNIALKHRNDLIEQTAEPQALAVLDAFAKGTPSVCAPTNSLIAIITNWRKADFFNVARFEAAVTAVGDTSPGRKNPPGTIVFNNAYVPPSGPTFANVFAVLGKDLEGNYWAQSVLLPSAWPTFEQALRELA
ncbi:hypothetical protein EG327_001484 [Venturia inaequalis]|uniref:Uncharacterized protein n=1 Tax=Venturia inaequalis TaxID=5025 RepID=A0A8H3VU29_VENIN|nr:hypothetical protein EG327_001484 [Venturia inaequalis]